MFRAFIREKAIRCALLPILFQDSDVVSKDTKTAQAADVSIVKSETGKERLVRMFTIDEFENFSPELNATIQVGCMSLFIGALYGGFMGSRTAYADFIKNNQATAFKDHLEAKKRLQDKVTISFGKGAFRWGWRLSLFSTAYVGLSSSISTYRGKHGIIEHVVAGTVSGMLYKFPMGPKGWLVGGGLGLVLGTVAGSITYGLLKLTGISMDEVRYWQYKWKEDRSRMFREGIQKQMEQDELKLMHDERVGPAGNTLDNLDKNITQKK